MIEMRWLDREIPAGRLHPATNVYPRRPRETVLQYRLPYNGCEWQDVPTVSDAADEGVKK